MDFTLSVTADGNPVTTTNSSFLYFISQSGNEFNVPISSQSISLNNYHTRGFNLPCDSLSVIDSVRFETYTLDDLCDNETFSVDMSNYTAVDPESEIEIYINSWNCANTNSFSFRLTAKENNEFLRLVKYKIIRFYDGADPSSNRVFTFSSSENQPNLNNFLISSDNYSINFEDFKDCDDVRNKRLFIRGNDIDDDLNVLGCTIPEYIPVFFADPDIEDCDIKVTNVKCEEVGDETITDTLSFDLTITQSGTPLFAPNLNTYDKVIEAFNSQGTFEFSQGGGDETARAVDILYNDTPITSRSNYFFPKVECDSIMDSTLYAYGVTRYGTNSPDNDIVCPNVMPFTLESPKAIPDNGFNGPTLPFSTAPSEAACIDLTWDTAKEARPTGVKLKVGHTWQGDLHGYIVSETANTRETLSLFSNIGGGSGCFITFGDASNPDPDQWLFFRDDGSLDPQNTSGTPNVGIATFPQGSIFQPSSGLCDAGSSTTFAGLNDPIPNNAIVTWKLCIADGYEDFSGNLCAADLLRDCPEDSNVASIPPHILHDNGTITSTADIGSNNTVIYKAQDGINLNHPFEVENNTIFRAEIKNCYIED